MSIPLDRLYEFVETTAQNACNDDVVIYRFWPHGSKKIQDLKHLRDYSWPQLLQSYLIICHDQEPLDFEGNQNNSDEAFKSPHSGWYRLLEQHGMVPNRFNLRAWGSIFDKCVLLHSEQRSTDVEQYNLNDYVPVYYWSHAIIAQDWFRYFKHYSKKSNPSKQFLIYNRAWTGTREYRVKFAEMLQTNDLLPHCQTWFNTVDPETKIYYKDHDFINTEWQANSPLDHVFETSRSLPTYSADINIADYENTEIEIVLETLFDDHRLHLTEKSLRPIACGHPFVLAATHGSLEYLKSYGFQTFESIWDESYDLESNPKIRMQKIIDLMITMTQWSPEQRAEKMQQAQHIVDHNKQHFYSQEFFNQITNELSENLNMAFDEIERTNQSRKFFASRLRLASVPEIRQILSNVVDHPDKDLNPAKYGTYNRQTIMQVVRRARQYYLGGQ